MYINPIRGLHWRVVIDGMTGAVVARQVAEYRIKRSAVGGLGTHCMLRCAVLAGDRMHGHAGRSTLGIRVDCLSESPKRHGRTWASPSRVCAP